MVKLNTRRVLMVCSQMPPIYGGAGAQAALLGRTLATMGWQVTSVTLDQARVGSSTENGIRFHRVRTGVKPSGKWSRAITTLALGIGSALRVLMIRPSIVHIHGAYWWSIPPAMVGRLVGAKVVVKLTRDGEDDARTVFAKYVGRIHVGRIYGLSLTLADAIIVLNKQSEKIAGNAGLGPRVRLIPNGVDDVKLVRSSARRIESRAARGLSENDRVVMFVGYIVKHKGVVDLLDAWRCLENRNAHLWLIGPSDGFYRELDNETPLAVERLKQDGYRVSAMGHLPATDLPLLYWAADVFVLPSYAEGMPNSLAEALVAGCHVVGTRIPGIEEIVGADSPDLITPGDVSALAARLARAMDSPQPASEAIAGLLCISNTAHAYQSLYQELLRSTK